MAETPKTSTNDADDQRAKFEAALAAKNAKGGHAGTSHAAGGKSGKGHSTAEGGKREFRRKSGG